MLPFLFTFFTHILKYFNTQCYDRCILDFYKRSWQVLFPVFAVLAGIVVQVIIFLNEKWYMPLLAISLAVLSLIFFIWALICYVKDFNDTRRRKKEAEAPSVYEKRGVITF